MTETLVQHALPDAADKSNAFPALAAVRSPQRSAGCRLKPGAMLLTAMALAFSVGLAQAADRTKGAETAGQVCAACHGKDGKTPIDPSYPIIAGQYADYIVQALRDYKSGARKNPIMGAQAKLLSSADMENVAAFYSSLPSDLRSKK